MLAQHVCEAAAALSCALKCVACCRKQGQPLIGVLMADSRHSLWDDSSERHLLFRHTEGRKEGMYLLPTAINLVYALQQGYDFIHFQVRFKLQHSHRVTDISSGGAQQLIFWCSCGSLPVPQINRA